MGTPGVISAMRGIRLGRGPGLALALLFALLTGRAWATVSIPDLEAKVKANPSDLRSRFLLGRAYGDEGDTDKALETYRDILATRKAPLVMFHMGLLLFKTGHPSDAISIWLDIVQNYKPNNVMVLRTLGAALYKQGSYDQSLEYLHRIIAIDPGDLKARLYIGADLFRVGQPLDAARALLMLLKLRPPDDIKKKAFVLLGYALVQLNKPGKARVVFERLAALDPANAAARKALEKLRAGQMPEIPPGPTAAGDATPGRGDPIKEPTQQYQGGIDITTHPQPIPPVQTPSHLPEGTQMSLQAEELFLDGLDQKEKGNYEKALYSFLQALDVDPKFTQVHLQVGEVYIQLARLAPTKAQFVERLDLALGALEKVNVLAPGTLLDHAAQGKKVVANKLKIATFGGYHKEQAQKALSEKREGDAFEEFVLLLSNDILSDDIFFALVSILPRLTQGNRQDLQYFLEDLSAKHPEQTVVPYLLGLVYQTTGKVNESRTVLEGFLDRLIKCEPQNAIVQKMSGRARAERPLPIDLYLMGSYHFAKQADREAMALLRQFVERSKKDAPFYTEALRKLAQLQAKAGPIITSSFDTERDALVRAVPKVEPLFKPYFEKAHCDAALLAELKTFAQGNSDNDVGRLALSCVLAVRGAVEAPPQGAELAKQADELSLQLLGAKPADADWHMSAGLRLLDWGQEDRARGHLKLTGDILLAQGLVQSSRHAAQALDAARQMLDAGHPGAAQILIAQAQEFDGEYLPVYLLRSQLARAQGKLLQAASSLVDGLHRALDLPWTHMIVMADLGGLILWALLAALLAMCAGLTLRHFEVLRHLFIEYLGHMGIMLGLTPQLFIGLICVVFFPSSFLLFFPVLVWPTLSRDERYAYAGLASLVALVPLWMPLCLAGSYQAVKMTQAVRDGDLAQARAYFEQRVKYDDGDDTSRYLLGLAQLRSGRLDEAAKTFATLYERNPYDAGVLVNQGVVEGRRGDLKKAATMFNAALAHQATDVAALYDLSALYLYQGNQEKAHTYMKWARAASRDPALILRYQAFSSDEPRLVLMDQPIDDARLKPLFSFFSTSNFLKLNVWMGYFCIWLMLGGGLTTYLWFLRERMDIVPTTCAQCLKVVCNICSRAVRQKILCVECAEKPPLDRDKEKSVTSEQKAHARQFRRGLGTIANLIIPGGGLYLADQPFGAAILHVAFFFLAWVLASGGGALMNAVYGPTTDATVSLVLALTFALATVVYLIAQAAFALLKESLP